MDPDEENTSSGFKKLKFEFQSPNSRFNFPNPQEAFSSSGFEISKLRYWKIDKNHSDLRVSSSQLDVK